MIEFDLASALPRALRLSDMKNLGNDLAKRLKMRQSRSVGVRFVSARDMQTLNRRYRGKNRPTDVLSFAIPDQSSLGDLAICSSYARKNNKNLRGELIRLLAHGVLHLAGFDHATARTEARMFRLQERCISTVLSST
ncbi:rRNA maturation RNase YbeY [Candidatus Uhrbacteria bacterium]|nr:rRNA maturation RNase YbeY [Candidatus Uhrbacteria bacterium]